MTATLVDPNLDTFADVLHRLGDVPPHRILWNPRPGTATEADQLRYIDGEPKRLVELVDGILVEKAMGHRESLFAASLIRLLLNFVEPRNLGVIGAPDAIMRQAHGRNRLPDVSFTPWEWIPDADSHLQPIADYPGDLMVEVISLDNTRRELAQKRREYFARGSRLIWIIDPDARTVAVYGNPANPDDHETLTENDTLMGDPVLSGFALKLADYFHSPQLNPRK